MQRDGRELENNSTQKKSAKNSQKQLKKGNYSAYLGGKNVGRWKRGGEQFYKKESANNTKKTPKKQKEREKIAKKTEIKGHTLVSKNIEDWVETGEEVYWKKLAKNSQKKQKNTKKAKLQRKNITYLGVKRCRELAESRRRVLPKKISQEPPQKDKKTP